MEETNVAEITDNIVATTTVANSELTPPQINGESDVQSVQDYRSAVSQTGQEENRDDGVFSDTPENPDDAAEKTQEVPLETLRISREVRGLGSVNNAGRKESLALSENGRSKRPPLDAAKKKYEDALSRVSQELTEFLDTYPKNVHVPVEERPDTKAKYKILRMKRGALELEAIDLRALFSKQGMTQDRNVLEQT